MLNRFDGIYGLIVLRLHPKINTNGDEPRKF